MKYEDKRPPVPRLMRPEDVNRAVRRTSPRKNRRARPSTPPPSVEAVSYTHLTLPTKA